MSERARDERRRHVRYRLVADLALVNLNGLFRPVANYTKPTLAPTWGTCGDVSAGGLLVQTEQKLAVGDEVTVRLFVDAEHSLLATCEVVRSDDGGGVGCRFVTLAPDTERWLNEELCELPPAN